MIPVFITTIRVFFPTARCDDLFVEPRHKDAVGVHFKTVLFYHFYHQEALKLFFDDSSFVYESFFFLRFHASLLLNVRYHL